MVRERPGARSVRGRGDGFRIGLTGPRFDFALLFDVFGTLGGWGAARGLGLDRRDSFTIGIEVGIQNVVIALLILEILGRPDLLPFVGYYALVKMPLAIVWVMVLGQPEAVRGPGLEVATDPRP